MPDLVASCGIFYLIFDFPTPKQTLLDISLITEIYHFIYHLVMVFQALMLYKLYYEKKVKSLDDPFKKYMPKFSIKDPFNSHEIVLR